MFRPNGDYVECILNDAATHKEIAPPKCAKNHELFLVLKGRPFTCSSCQTSKRKEPKQGPRWFCHRCQLTICKKCKPIADFALTITKSADGSEAKQETGHLLHLYDELFSCPISQSMRRSLLEEKADWFAQNEEYEGLSHAIDLYGEILKLPLGTSSSRALSDLYFKFGCVLEQRGLKWGTAWAILGCEVLATKEEKGWNAGGDRPQSQRFVKVKYSASCDRKAPEFVRVGNLRTVDTYRPLTEKERQRIQKGDKALVFISDFQRAMECFDASLRLLTPLAPDLNNVIEDTKKNPHALKPAGRGSNLQFCQHNHDHDGGVSIGEVWRGLPREEKEKWMVCQLPDPVERVAAARIRDDESMDSDEYLLLSAALLEKIGSLLCMPLCKTDADIVTATTLLEESLARKVLYPHVTSGDVCALLQKLRRVSKRTVRHAGRVPQPLAPSLRSGPAEWAGGDVTSAPSSPARTEGTFGHNGSDKKKQRGGRSRKRACATRHDNRSYEI